MVTRADGRNCRNCGAAPDGKTRCRYCGTVDVEQVRYLVTETAMKTVVSLGATGYAGIPDDMAIRMLRLNPPILRRPTPGQKMTV